MQHIFLNGSMFCIWTHIWELFRKLFQHPTQAGKCWTQGILKVGKQFSFSFWFAFSESILVVVKHAGPPSVYVLGKHGAVNQGLLFILHHQQVLFLSTWHLNFNSFKPNILHNLPASGVSGLLVSWLSSSKQVSLRSSLTCTKTKTIAHRWYSGLLNFSISLLSSHSSLDMSVQTKKFADYATVIGLANNTG